MQGELTNIVQNFSCKKLALEKDLTLQHTDLVQGMKSQELAFESFTDKIFMHNHTHTHTQIAL